MAAVLGVFLRHLWLLIWSIGVLWVSFGAPCGDICASLEILLAIVIGALGVLWGSVGCPRAPVGRRWAPRDRFPGLSGKFREPFWHDFGYLLHVFLIICWGLFFDRFVKRFCIDVDVILEAVLESFVVNFQTSRDMLQPTKTL